MQNNQTCCKYDSYWKTAEGRRDRRLRRSLERARLALELFSIRKGRLLDVGCGPGDSASLFAQAGFEVLGVEVSPYAASVARERGIEVVLLDIEKETLPAGPFQAIAALEVLEHLRDPLDAFFKMLSALSPSGEIVFSLPNDFHLVNRLGLLLGLEPFGGYDDVHVRHFGSRSVRKFTEATGATVFGTRTTSLIPPGMGGSLPPLRWLGAFLARLCPRLFAMSFLVGIRKAR